MRFLCSSPILMKILFLVTLLAVDVCVYAFSGQPQSSKSPVRVLVTGAAGKTGRIVLSKLERDNRYEPKGLFRTEQSARKIVNSDETLCALEHVVVADITSSTFLQDLSDGMNSDGEDSGNDMESSNGLENIEAMIICTSAVPRIRKRSLVAMFAKAPWRIVRGEPFLDIHSMRFAWKHGGYPEKVDYQGQIAQIDLAKKLGIGHVVLVSSMGGTDPENFLNTVGADDGHGDILLWKRQAEKYLVQSGLDYTILHPGHLVDSPGGEEEFVLGVDDELYELNHSDENNQTSDERKLVTHISREDLAELCVASLSVGKGKQVSFDCITLSSTSSTLLPNSKTQQKRSPTTSGGGAGTPSLSSTSSAEASTSTTTITATSETPSTTGRKSAEKVLTDFFELSITTNYDLDP